MAEQAGVTDIREVETPEPTGPTLDTVFGDRASLKEAVAEAVVEGDEAQHQPRAEPDTPLTVADEEQPRDELGKFVKEEEAEPAAEIPEEEIPEEEIPEEEVDSLVVTVSDGKGEFDIEFDDPATAAAISELKERAGQVGGLEARVKAAEQTVQDTETNRRALTDIRQEMADDPIAFLSENVRQELRQELVLDLLMDEETYKATLEEITKWENDPRNRELKAAQRGEQLAKSRLEGRDRRQQSQAIAVRSERIVQTVQSFIPESMSATDARHFFHDMIRDVQEHVRETNTNDMSDADIERVVTRRFQQYGVDGTRSTVARDESGAVVAQPADEETKRLVRARKAGSRLSEKHQRRRAAGATAPGGAGSPVTRAGPPKGASLGEALEFARRQTR